MCFFTSLTPLYCEGKPTNENLQQVATFFYKKKPNKPSRNEKAYREKPRASQSILYCKIVQYNRLISFQRALQNKFKCCEVVTLLTVHFHYLAKNLN